MEKGRLVKVGIVIVAVLVVVFAVWYFTENETGIIERKIAKSSVSPGEVVEISLDIRLGEGQDYYLIEESIPKEFVALNDNVGKDNKIRLAEIQGAKSTVFTYEVEAPQEKGIYVFSGEYGMRFIEGTKLIAGDNTIVVG